MLLELSLHAVALKNQPGILRGTSDPYAVVTKIAARQGDQPEVLGRTECLRNSLNPDWTETITLHYRLGVAFKIAITIFDENKKRDDTAMGNVVFEVGEIIATIGNCQARKLKKGGTIYATIGRIKGDGFLNFKMKGSNLKRRSIITKLSPFFEISRKSKSRGTLIWDTLYRSQTIKNNLDPDWELSTIAISKLCSGNLDLPLQITVYDYEKSGHHVLIGHSETSVTQLKRIATKNKTIKIRRSHKVTGTLIIEMATIHLTKSSKLERTENDTEKKFKIAEQIKFANDTFIDFISAGCELNVAVAIDYTSSNGNPRDPNSLHYLFGGSKNDKSIDNNTSSLNSPPDSPDNLSNKNPDQNQEQSLLYHNDYEKAIIVLLNMLKKYDTDQMYPVFGFGAKYDGILRDRFQVGDNLCVRGTKGVLNAYHRAFKNGLTLSGPRDFSSIIKAAAFDARLAQQNAARTGRNAYLILIILTNGACIDKQRVMDALIHSSDSPISIVVVGIGNDPKKEFEELRALDDFLGNKLSIDDGSNHRGPDIKGRDLLKFVQFNEFAGDIEALTEHTLDEIPRQLTEYYTSKGIKPSAALRHRATRVKVEEAEEIDLHLTKLYDGEIVIESGGTISSSKNFEIT